jgi:UDP-N-acetylmuramoyl-tripeptide--D-alanyl-D-alanine ligase
MGSLNFNVDELLQATGGKLMCGSLQQNLSGIFTDTRKKEAGGLYIALAGERFDGHGFVMQALEEGAGGAVISTPLTPEDLKKAGSLGKCILQVDNTRDALGWIARRHRLRCGAVVVAVTGSAGKTSTKDMLSRVLAARYPLISTEGNQNNEIGVPLTLLRLTPEKNNAAVEMGMRGRGEIRWLSRIALPDLALITNIGAAHIERLGSLQEILNAKLEIMDGMKPGSLIFLNSDDPLLNGSMERIRKEGFVPVGCGIGPAADVRGVDIRMGEQGCIFQVKCTHPALTGVSFEVRTPLPGLHNVQNALLSAGAGIAREVSPEQIAAAISGFQPSGMRMQQLQGASGADILNDAYNANPLSVKAALETLAAMGQGRRLVAVLGTMLELGEWSGPAHEEAGFTAAKLGVGLLVAVGPDGDHTVQGAIRGGLCPEAAIQFAGAEEAARFLRSVTDRKDFVLIKGSRGMRMEVIVEELVR